MIGIPVDVLNRLLGSVDAHLGWACEFAGAINDSRL